MGWGIYPSGEVTARDLSGSDEQRPKDLDAYGYGKGLSRGSRGTGDAGDDRAASSQVRKQRG